MKIKVDDSELVEAVSAPPRSSYIAGVGMLPEGFFTLKDIADGCAVHQRTILRYINELTEKGQWGYEKHFIQMRSDSAYGRNGSHGVRYLTKVEVDYLFLRKDLAAIWSPRRIKRRSPVLLVTPREISGPNSHEIVTARRAPTYATQSRRSRDLGTAQIAPERTTEAIPAFGAAQQLLYMEQLSKLASNGAWIRQDDLCQLLNLTFRWMSGRRKRGFDFHGYQFKVQDVISRQYYWVVKQIPAPSTGIAGIYPLP